MPSENGSETGVPVNAERDFEVLPTPSTRVFTESSGMKKSTKRPRDSYKAKTKDLEALSEMNRQREEIRRGLEEMKAQLEREGEENRRRLEKLKREQEELSSRHYLLREAMRGNRQATAAINRCSPLDTHPTVGEEGSMPVYPIPGSFESRRAAIVDAEDIDLEQKILFAKLHDVLYDEKISDVLAILGYKQ